MCQAGLIVLRRNAAVGCALVVAIAEGSAFGGGRSSDFNGDGFDDLPVAVSREDVGAIVDAGAVHVFYGSAEGVTAAGDQYFTANSAGVPGGSQGGDFFGRSLAWGDFNGDGFADLAIGLPGRQVADDEGAGAVHVMYGSAAGLSASMSRFIKQGMAGNAPAPDDGFGSSLAVGDFNGDGHDDLAVAAPGEDADGQSDSGMVHVIPGSNSGLRPQNATWWTQDTPDMPDASEPGDGFGEAMAGGDFDGDGRDDLAIGAPMKDVGVHIDAGAAFVLYGGADGLQSGGARIWHQNLTSVLDESLPDEHFGEALAAGDFDGDARDDLAIGVPGETVNNIDRAGIVHVLYGGTGGLSSANDQRFDEPGSEPIKEDEEFGQGLATGDVNGDGRDDLLVSVSNNWLAAGQHGAPPVTRLDSGAVYVLRGSGSGLATANNQRLWQGTHTTLAFERFGATVLVADFNNDQRDDLAIGVPGERVSLAFRAGKLHLAHGHGGLLSLGSGVTLSQDAPGVKETAEPMDGFGE